MKKIAVFFCIILLCITLSGCADIGGIARDDRKFMVSAIGFDEQDGQIKAVVEIIVINSENYDTSAETRVISATGKSIEDAVNLIASSLTKPMLLNHCGIIGIGKSIDEYWFQKICDYAFYDERITLSAYMITTEDCEKLLNGKPEASVAVGYDMMGIIEQESSQSGVAYNSRYFEVEEQRQDQKKAFSLPHFVRKDERISVDGMMVFHGDKQVKHLDIDESGLYALITGELRKGAVEIESGDYKITKRKMEWGRNSIKLIFKLIEGNEKELEKMIMDFKQKMEKESDLDIFGFSALLNQRYPGMKKKEEDFKDIDFSVECYTAEEKKYEGKNGAE